MTDDLHLMVSSCVFAAILLCSTVAQSLSGLAYPGTSAPLVPEGPLRTMLIADAIYFGIACIHYLIR